MRFDSRLGTVISTTDLLKFLSCEELSTFDNLRCRGLLEPVAQKASSNLAAQLGLATEADSLTYFSSLYPDFVKISGSDEAAHRATVSAMEKGVTLIYQGLLLSKIGNVVYQSRPDFLIRTDYPSNLGSYSYEPIDSKLAKSPQLEGVFQVVDYADALSLVQGVLPRRVHLYLAGSFQASFNTESYIEEIRLQKERFLRHIAAIPSISVDNDLFAKLDPRPNNHCALCDWSSTCESYWEKSDSLFQVAAITKSQVKRLNQAGITSLRQLANSTVDEISVQLSSSVLETLIAQARAQLKTFEQGSARPYYELRADAHDTALGSKGLALLPDPDAGDIFFDIEGDPFYKPDGLEYLLGICYLEQGSLQFRAFWGTDREKEKNAFGDLVEFIFDRWKRYPNLHIYHYADYERSALARLASRTNFKIFEVDTILRNDLLVDLYPVVKGSLIVGTDSYSLKRIEKLYLEEARQEAVTTALGSVESFEAWLGNGDPSLLEEIERYNEMDVRSTAKLRDFLLRIRDDLVLESGPIPPRGKASLISNDGVMSEYEAKMEALEAALDAQASASERAEDQNLYRLCSQLVRFHNREEKPLWWRYFNLTSPEREASDFFSDPECIGGLVKIGEGIDDTGALIETYEFDPQQTFKGSQSLTLFDPEWEDELRKNPELGKGMVSVGNVTKLELSRGLIEIKRNRKYPAEFVPNNLVGWSRVSAKVIEDALARFATGLIEVPSLATDEVGIEVLRRGRPRFRTDDGVCGLTDFLKALNDSGESMHRKATAAAFALDNSYLIIQGPPGSGKTFLSAQVVTELVKAGKKVFVTSNSHSAIDNLFEVVARNIARPDQLFRVNGSKAKKMDGVTYCSSSDVEGLIHREGGLLCGGTMWTGAREELAKSFDYGVIDEAGQFSLANAIALATSCKNLVLSGDPQQLSQPILGSHPGGAALSILEHLVGDREVVEEDYGLFLPHTYRMHPYLTDVVSAISYDSRLSATEELGQLELVDSAPFPQHGLAYVPVEHTGNSQRSLEEGRVAKRVAKMLLSKSWIDKNGHERKVTPDQILVVAPYNAQVNALSIELDGLASVGTVDKFQGREAAFVIVSMAASDGEASSRGVDFLFSTNRLNVAISRAKVMSIVLACPALIETKPASLDQLELLGAVTKIIKSAVLVDPQSLPNL